MKILLIEDDYFQAQVIIDELKINFREPLIEIINSEEEFKKRFHTIQENLPDLVIIDVMLRWYNPSPKVSSRPEELHEEGFHRAGLRCVNLLLSNLETKNMPIIIYSVLNREDISEEIKKMPHHILFVQKTDVVLLVNAIRSLLPELANTKSKNANHWRRFWDSMELKPGWLGIKIDLKRFFKRINK